MQRREALKWIAFGSLSLGCQGQRSDGGSSPSAHPLRAIAELPPSPNPWPTPDPFLFCVHHDDAYPVGNEVQGPDPSTFAGRDMGQDFAGRDGWRMYHGRAVPGFPMHPHRGFETVTVVRRGLLDHSDSLGATARYGQGDVQWLTAGAGIQHAEMFPLVDAHAPNPVELFQIWMNLPAARKFANPYFSMLWADAIPRHTLRDASGRATEVVTIAGSLAGVAAAPPPPESWAAGNNDVAIWTIKMSPNATWTMPPARAGTNRWLYFFRGAALSIDGRAIPPSHVAELQPDATCILANGAGETECLLLQGAPIGEPVVKHGPFVMNTRAEINQAIRDYQLTQFGGWSWASHEPVHARDAGRFAKHADGRIDKPKTA